jgi:diguanylate cyclase (GGDEF)-like protein/PAS domain S-box-containing protein
VRATVSKPDTANKHSFEICGSIRSLLETEDGPQTEKSLCYLILERLAEGLVLVDEAGLIQEWNRAMEEITGVPRALVLGRAVWDVYREHVALEDTASADIRALVKELIRQATRDPSSPRLRARAEFTWVRPEGDRRVMRTNAFAVRWSGRSAVGYVAEDITEDRRAESALRLTQLSVDRAADLIHWIAPDGRLLYVSDSNCERHGYSRKELLGMTIFDIDPLLTREIWEQLWREMRKRGSFSLESLHRTKAGELFPVEVVVNHVRDGEREYNFVYARDITRRKRAEEDLQRAMETLEVSNRELKEAMRAAEEAGHRLKETNQVLLITQKALALQARTDPLTGCLNRGAVLSRLEEESERARRTGGSLAVGMVDIDHFKKINDTYGHPAGDRVLCEVVARLQKGLRPYDFFGRFGGEEFLVVITAAEKEQATSALERMRVVIADKPVQIDGREIPVRVSIGGALGRKEPAEVLIRLADEALYRAKGLGRNRLEMSGPAGMRAGASSRRSQREGSPGSRSKKLTTNWS